MPQDVNSHRKKYFLCFCSCRDTDLLCRLLSLCWMLMLNHVDASAFHALCSTIYVLWWAVEMLFGFVLVASIRRESGGALGYSSDVLPGTELYVLTSVTSKDLSPLCCCSSRRREGRWVHIR